MTKTVYKSGHIEYCTDSRRSEYQANRDMSLGVANPAKPFPHKPRAKPKVSLYHVVIIIMALCAIMVVSTH